jgi:hypothetical protein
MMCPDLPKVDVAVDDLVTSRKRYTTARVVLYILSSCVLLYALFFTVGSIYAILVHGISVVEILQRYRETPHVYACFVGLVLACATTLARWSWGAHLARSSALWMLSIQLVHVPLLIHNVLPTFFGVSADRFTEGVSKGLILILFGYFVFLVTLVVSGNAVERARKLAYASRAGITSARLLPWGQRLLAGSVITIVVGLLISAWGPELVGWRARSAGRIVLIIAGLLAVGGQCLTREWFGATSALTMAAILMPLHPIGSTMIRTLEIWVPVVVLGWAGYRSQGRPRWLAAAALGLPLLLLFTAVAFPRVVPAPL